MITGDYAIVVEGELSPALRAAFEPAEVRSAAGTTTVRAAGVDQAALHRILERARDLGLTLLLVRCEDHPV